MTWALMPFESLTCQEINSIPCGYRVSHPETVDLLNSFSVRMTFLKKSYNPDTQLSDEIFFINYVTQRDTLLRLSYDVYSKNNNYIHLVLRLKKETDWIVDNIIFKTDIKVVRKLTLDEALALFRPDI